MQGIKGNRGPPGLVGLQGFLVSKVLVQLFLLNTCGKIIINRR